MLKIARRIDQTNVSDFVNYFEHKNETFISRLDKHVAIMSARRQESKKQREKSANEKTREPPVINAGPTRQESVTDESQTFTDDVKISSKKTILN